MPEYFTLAELRALSPLSDTTKYPDARCEAVAAWAVATIEGFVGTSFVARSLTETHDSDGDVGIPLLSPWPIDLTTVTEAGASVVTSDCRTRSGVLTRPGTVWSGEIAVTYTAGYSTSPPADVKEAALQATRFRLLDTNSNATIPGRVQSQNSDQTTVEYASTVPTGYPTVDRVLSAWRDRLNVFGFA